MVGGLTSTRRRGFAGLMEPNQQPSFSSRSALLQTRTLGWKGRWRVRHSSSPLALASALQLRQGSERQNPPPADRRLQANQTTTDSSRTTSRPIRSREINPPKQTDRLSRGGSECRNCVITDGIGDSSNLCPAVSDRTNPQAVILHIKSEKAKPSDFQQAAAGMHRSGPPRREGRRHGDRCYRCDCFIQHLIMLI